MKNYRYIAPGNSAFSLPSPNEGEPPTDILLFVGKEYELPEDNGYVKSLLAQGYLEEVVVVQTAAKKTNKKEEQEVNS